MQLIESAFLVSTHNMVVVRIFANEDHRNKLHEQHDDRNLRRTESHTGLLGC